MSRNPITRSLILGLMAIGIALVPALAQAAPRHDVAAGESWSLVDAFHSLWTAIWGAEGTGADPNKTSKLTTTPTAPPAAAAAAPRFPASARRSAVYLRTATPPAGRRR